MTLPAGTAEEHSEGAENSSGSAAKETRAV
jgi:hypothetical protein